MEAQTDSTLEKGRSPHPFPIPAFVGPLVQSRQTTPCPTYFDISFLESKELPLHAVLTDGLPPAARMSIYQRRRSQRLDAIVFRNFYCSHMTIKQRRQRLDPETVATSTAAAGNGVDGDPWVTILRDRPLMENPHYEDDAQYWHVVTVDEFDREEYDAESTAPLRIYLYQSSPMWKAIGLHHVKLISWSSSGASNGTEGDASTVCNSSGWTGTDSHLGDLCRGISEQVEIFGDKRRLRQMS